MTLIPIETAARRLLLVLSLLFATTLLAGCGINNIPTYEENAKAQWSQVLSQYQRRAELIPNLVKTVKGFAEHEKAVLTAVVEARAKATSLNLPPDKAPTAEQLQQGAFWLISRLHDLDNFAERLGVFIENYEKSPKRGKLAIPRPRPELDGLNMLGRLMKYILINASPEEKKIFARMLDYAAHFSHPQSWNLVLAAFVGVLNVRRMMLEIDPNMERVGYPV
jgi:hypothetical protein